MSHEEHQQCIDACYACATACDHCAVACLTEPHVVKMVDCIRTDLDCAAICRLAAEAMAHGSDFMKQICALCADICERCAAICEKHDVDHCQECAEACRACAMECRKMA